MCRALSRVLLCFVLVAADASRVLAQAADVPGRVLILPIVVSAHGAYGASYVSTLTISADSPAPIEALFTLYPRDGSPLERRLTLSAFPSTLTLGQVFGALPEVSGWLRIEAGRPLRVTSTTAGATFHAVPASAALLAGERSSLGSAMRLFVYDPKVRYSHGVAEVGGRPASARTCLQGTWARSWAGSYESGTFGSCWTFDLAPHASAQVTLFATDPRSWPPAGAVTSAETVVAVTGGEGMVVAWATAVNTENEATAFEMAPGAGLAAALGPAPRRLVLTKAGTGRGTVASPGGSVRCEAACDATVLELDGEEPLLLVAEPDPESVLASLQGCDRVEGDRCWLDTLSGRRVTATFNRSALTVDVFGFLDVSVGAGGEPNVCRGPRQRCLFPIPPRALVRVDVSRWPGVVPEHDVLVTGPGCDSTGCRLTVTADPTVIDVRATQGEASRLAYLGAHPSVIRKGESARLLVRADGCNLTGHFEPGPAVDAEGPGLYRVSPETTTTYTYLCYYRLPGSTRSDLMTRSATVTVTPP